MVLIRFIAGTGILSLFLTLSAHTVFAFIDTNALSENLSNIERDLGGDQTGLEGLLTELDAAAGENVDAYLQITDIKGRKLVTIWDVPKTAWFYPYVLALSELGIVSGYKGADGNLSGAYGPGNNVTRAEALKISLGSAGIDPSSCEGSPAHPQAKTHWAKQYVVCAEQRILGLDLKDALDGPASRAEVLHYVLQSFGIALPDGNPPFADSRSHRFTNDIAYAYALGIISGDTNPDGSEKGTFRPDDPINRAEVAKIAKLAIELL